MKKLFAKEDMWMQAHVHTHEKYPEWLGIR